MAKVRDILLETKKLLQSYNIAAYALEAELLLAKAIGKFIERRDLILILEDSVSTAVENKINDMIKLRQRNMPVAYILGKKHFWNFDFDVTQDVLIPRPETELIVDLALKYVEQGKISVQKNNLMQILDLGIGSGCLLLTILKEFCQRDIDATGIGVDISPEAISVAKENAKKLYLDEYIEFYVSDWWEKIDTDRQFDFIVSNPPYISSSEWKNLMPDVRDYEPMIALTDNADGLTHYRVISEKLPRHMHSNSIAFFECGYMQAERVIQIFEHNNLHIIEVVKDLNGIDRVIAVKL
ncbi:Release factor glutamine methyltransferase [Alphaproteobacteria bacterium]